MRRGAPLCQPVYLFDEEKDHEGDNGKVQDRVNEISVIDGGSRRHFRRGQRCVVLAIEADKQVAEVDIGSQPSDGRHDDIVYQGSDNGPERRAHDDAHGKVQDIAPHDKLFEFLKHSCSLLIGRTWAAWATLRYL